MRTRMRKFGLILHDVSFLIGFVLEKLNCIRNRNVIVIFPRISLMREIGYITLFLLSFITTNLLLGVDVILYNLQFYDLHMFLELTHFLMVGTQLTLKNRG